MAMMSDVLQYRDLAYWSPIASARMEAVLDLMELDAGERVLEIGCGRAELGLRLVERFGVAVTALDRSEHAMAQARDAARARVPDAVFECLQRDIGTFSAQPGEYAAIACVGGPRVAENLSESWRTLLSWLRPGGYLLAGEGFWEKDPDPAYLAATGIAAEEMNGHWENIETARALGATVLYTQVSSREEWDGFEGRILYNIERYAAEHPDDPEVRAMLARRRAFYDAQMRWGRGTMGFAVYLLQA